MSNLNGLIETILISALPVLLAITVHEAAHGYVAWLKGDPTAKMLGRVTLNPLAHIDPVGTILVPGILLVQGFITGKFVLFGWAKPVPVNYRLLSDPKRDPIYVAAAGVMTNLMLAGVSALVFRLIVIANPTGGEFLLLPLALMLARSVQFNLLLAFFNLIPIPPLDGGRIATGLLPFHASMRLASLERYGVIIVMLLIWINPLGIMDTLLWNPITSLTSSLLGGGVFGHGG